MHVYCNHNELATLDADALCIVPHLHVDKWGATFIGGASLLCLCGVLSSTLYGCANRNRNKTK